MIENPEQDNTPAQKYEFFAELRELRHATLVNCIGLFMSELHESGYTLADFIAALSSHLHRAGHPQTTVAAAEELAQQLQHK
jgi:hypothetical protein